MELLVGGLVLAVITASALAWLASAVWVYRDARRRSLDNAVWWGAGAVLTGYFGLFVYVTFQGSSRNAALDGSTD